MRRVTFVLAIICAVVGRVAVGGNAPVSWVYFTSKVQHFTVRYPSSWHRFKTTNGSVDNERLTIINFPNEERVSGVIIKEFGALIDANIAPDDFGSVEDWIPRYAPSNKLLEDHGVPLTKPEVDGCQKLRIVLRDELGPGRFSIETNYFCSTGRGLYIICLTNWEGDPHQAELQETVLEIVLSLRSR